VEVTSEAHVLQTRWRFHEAVNPLQRVGISRTYVSNSLMQTTCTRSCGFPSTSSEISLDCAFPLKGEHQTAATRSSDSSTSIEWQSEGCSDVLAVEARTRKREGSFYAFTAAILHLRGAQAVDAALP
jgi:hypothetical protein